MSWYRDSRHLYDIEKIEPMITFNDSLKELKSAKPHKKIRQGAFCIFGHI